MTVMTIITIIITIVNNTVNYQVRTLHPQYHRSRPLRGYCTVHISTYHNRAAHVFVLQEPASFRGSWNAWYDVFVVHYTETVSHELVEFLQSACRAVRYVAE